VPRLGSIAPLGVHRKQVVDLYDEVTSFDQLLAG
jgi:hypothetical protein